MHTTNYRDTFIAIATDSSATRGLEPAGRSKPTVASLCFELIRDNPYKYTSDDVLFTVFAARNDIPMPERDEARKAFFAKPQACMRASDLAKKWGWGIHADEHGRVALYGVESEEYQAFVAGEKRAKDGAAVTVTRAMRSAR